MKADAVQSVCPPTSPARNCSPCIMLEYSVVLLMSDTDYVVVERSFCGFAWEIEVKDDKDHANIILSCNRGLEGNSWQCTAVVTIHMPGISKVISTFHSKQRSIAIAVPCTEELRNPIKITIGLQDVSGCRDVAMFKHDFTKPSELTNACIAFENSDTRVYVIREYLLLNSRRIATLLKRIVPPRECTPVYTSNRSECSDLDVLSSQTTLNDLALGTEDVEDTNSASPLDIDVTTLPSTVYQEDGIYLLRGVNAEDFITLLKAIHPPFAEVTNENVESLLATAFRLGVEHIIWKCETFLRTEGARRSFDVFSRLVFAITYKMSALENDCLAALQSVSDVRTVLMDSRMESAPQELRIVLLETLFQRLTSETHPASLKANAVSEASQTHFLSAASNDTEVASTENGPQLCQGMARSKAEQEEVQGKGKMSINKQEEAAEDINKSVSDTCATSPHLDQRPVEISERGITVQRKRIAEKHNSEWKFEYVDFPGLLVCEAINAIKLSGKAENLWFEDIRLSARSIFADLVLPPTNSLKAVVCSFASHFFTKIQGHYVFIFFGLCYTELPERLHPHWIDIISASIIAGCEFDVQVRGNNLLFDRLKAYLQSQLRDYEYVAKTAEHD